MEWMGKKRGEFQKERECDTVNRGGGVKKKEISSYEPAKEIANDWRRRRIFGTALTKIVLRVMYIE